MATLSLRQALTPTGNWAILDVHDSTESVKVDGLQRSSGAWTYVYVYNPNVTAVAVDYEILAADGKPIVASTRVDIQPRATAYVVWSGPKFHTGTMLLRCPQPILPAAYRGQGAERCTLTVHPQPAG